MSDFLLSYPGHILSDIANYHKSELYLTCPKLRDIIRYNTTRLELRLLKSPSQTQVFPRLRTLIVHAIDLASHSLPDYLTPTIRDLRLLHVTMTREIYASVPPTVVRLTINRRTDVFRYLNWDSLCSGGADDYLNGYYSEYNLSVTGDASEFIHSNMAHLETEHLLDVRSLNLESANLRPDDENGIEWPSTLTDLVTDDVPEKLQEGLVSFSGLLPHGGIDLGTLPRSLTRYRVRDGDVYVQDKEGKLRRRPVSFSASSLPPSLTDLMVNCHVIEDDLRDIVSSNVIHLGLATMYYDNYSLLAGSKLVSLFVTAQYCIELGNLPRTLRVLSCCSLNTDDGAQWPLLLELAVAGEVLSAPPYPTTLRKLTTDYSSWLSSTQSVVPRDYSVMNTLVLHGLAGIYHIHVATDFPPNLTALSMPDTNEPTIISLPSTLQHLILPLSDNQVTPPLLPEGLLTLSLIGDRVLLPAFMRHLPRGLRELSVNHKFPMECIKQLPPRLVRLDAEYLDGNIVWKDLPESLAFIAGYNEYSLEDHEDDMSPKHGALCHRLSFECRH